MSSIVPLLPLVGLGVPEALWKHAPAICPWKALIAGAFCYNFPSTVKFLMIWKKTNGKYDNHNPRAQSTKLTSESGELAEQMAKAEAAHHNGLETYPLFASGVIAAMTMGVDKEIVGKLAFTHLMFRMAFNTIYIWGGKKIADLRSLCWVFSMFASCQLLVMASKKLNP